MTFKNVTAHPQRISLSNELHARPFPEIAAPGRAAHIAIQTLVDGVAVADQEILDCLVSLLDHYGSAHPVPDANHHFTQLGGVAMKWERHTEFMTFSLFSDTAGETPFGGTLFTHFPDAWQPNCRGY